MSDPQIARSVADREATDWHVRLGERPVSAETLAAFKAWRATPANAEAYHRVETVWRSMGTLSGDQDIQDITRETLRTSRPAPRRTRSRALVPALAVLVPVVVAAVALSLWLPARGVHETEVGELRIVRLEDGTQVRLDTDTRLKVRFEGDQRRVFLEQGQALFEVAHDAARPFRVVAGETEVTALGTVFDVRRETSGARVTLVQGAVAVTETGVGDARRWRLAPGQQVETARANAAPRAVDPEVATSWSEGRLIFRGAPLSDAIAEVNRYLPEKIVLAPGPDADVSVNGVFETGDREAFVSAVTDLFGLTAEARADGSVRLSRSAGG
ncbi:MAG: FecR domain-containing protein [Brevundimonas sp.]|uniref:FecR family protein n=1 Tax=Brevundimonas sp. TaxID=1871086 RepID=UPI00258D7FF4|nr:FecR domain-containing protein [Brevundimonas sp.]MCV0415713.1 FecR domain-containing protein [Brevundimonas sp.]